MDIKGSGSPSDLACSLLPLLTKCQLSFSVKKEEHKMVALKLLSLAVVIQLACYSHGHFRYGKRGAQFRMSIRPLTAKLLKMLQEESTNEPKEPNGPPPAQMQHKTEEKEESAMNGGRRLQDGKLGLNRQQTCMRKNNQQTEIKHKGKMAEHKKKLMKKRIIAILNRLESLDMDRQQKKKMESSERLMLLSNNGQEKEQGEGQLESCSDTSDAVCNSLASIGHG